MPPTQDSPSIFWMDGCDVVLCLPPNLYQCQNQHFDQPASHLRFPPSSQQDRYQAHVLPPNPAQVRAGSPPFCRASTQACSLLSLPALYQLVSLLPHRATIRRPSRALPPRLYPALVRAVSPPLYRASTQACSRLSLPALCQPVSLLPHRANIQAFFRHPFRALPPCPSPPPTRAAFPPVCRAPIQVFFHQPNPVQHQAFPHPRCRRRFLQRKTTGLHQALVRPLSRPRCRPRSTIRPDQARFQAAPHRHCPAFFRRAALHYCQVPFPARARVSPPYSRYGLTRADTAG